MSSQRAMLAEALRAENINPYPESVALSVWMNFCSLCDSQYNQPPTSWLTGPLGNGGTNQLAAEF